MSPDRSIAWFEACERVRAQLGAQAQSTGGAALSANAGCFLYPSIEAGLLELTELLADREREISGSRSLVAIGKGFDPSLDIVAQAMSAKSLTVQARPLGDWTGDLAWFAAEKTKLLFALIAEDDRFSGAIHELATTEAAILAAGVRVPLITLSFFGSRWVSAAGVATSTAGAAGGAAAAGGYFPSFAIRGVELASGAALFVVGERLRLAPKLAPYAMSETDLAATEAGIAILLGKPGDSSHAAGGRAADRTLIEEFEAKLAPPFQACWPRGASRVLDRAVLQTSAIDGSWLRDQLLAKFSAGTSGTGSTGASTGPSAANKKIDVDSSPSSEAFIETLSGCRHNDERRQEWLRAREAGNSEAAWLIRGTLHISVNFLRTHGADKVHTALMALANEHAALFL